MGDPVAAGTELNRIHRPRFPGVLFGIAVFLTLSGIFMQYILYGSEPLNTTYSNTAFMQHAVFYQMIGFGIILFGMFSNYMCLSKYSWFYTVCFWDLRCSPASFRARSLSGRPVPLAIICVCCIHCPMHCCYTPTGKRMENHCLAACAVTPVFGAILSHTSGFVWPPVLAFVFLSVLLSGICIQKGFCPVPKRFSGAGHFFLISESQLWQAACFYVRKPICMTAC